MRSFSGRSKQAEPIEVAGVRLNNLLNPSLEVIDPTPAELRDKLHYWRGISLSKVACNLIQGNPILNTSSDNNEISFSYYVRARSVAEQIATIASGARFQFTEADRVFLEDTLERPVSPILPAMVVALDPSVQIEDRLVDLERYDHVTPITELEAHSQQALEAFFSIKIA